MIKLNINVVTLAVGLALSVPAIAAEISDAEYATAEAAISAEFETDKAACELMSGNASDICLATANGKESVAMADLEVKNEPTPETRMDAQIARAEADFAIAKEHCDDAEATAQTQCMQDAQMAEAAAKAKADKAREMELVSAN